MCCGLALLAFFGPRILGAFWWLFRPIYFTAGFPSIVWPILGLIFLPWTTIAYVAVYPGGINGLELFGILFPLGLMTDATGWYRPIIIGMYFPAIPFFFGLSQAMRLLNLIDKNKAFSEISITALKNIKISAGIISGLFVIGMPYIFWVADRDDAPGVAAIGFVIIFASFVVATAAAVFQRLFQNAVDIKSENDLTI